MKKSYYQISQKIASNVFLCSSFISNYHILLSEEAFRLYSQETELYKLKKKYPEIFNRLVTGKFIIDQDIDEFENIENQRHKDIHDQSLYHIIINPTLDCNLSCWYCYETRIPKSRMSKEDIIATCKHIEEHYKNNPFKELKLSFFGGEPFLNFKAIKEISSFAQFFCKKNELNLLLDFTTNGSLISQSALNFLQDFRCMFQITLDGNREQHNKIKHTISKKIDTFGVTTNNIRRIQKYIDNSFIAVRINYDKDTLKGFDSILSELLPLDRKRMKIILKKIWQVNSDEISQDILIETMEKLFANNFVVDYYGQGGVCFADRKNQAVINYDGQIFKCTTISSFDEENSLGKINTSTGKIQWYQDKLEYLDKGQTPTECKTCYIYPSCGGPCKKKLENTTNWECFLKQSKFGLSEFALNQFRINVVRSNIYKNQKVI